MFFTKRKAIILIIICSIFFILTYNDVRSEEIKEISGNAQIIDGDTIKINSKKIRLYGIDAPEFKQTCKKTYLTIGECYKRNLNLNSWLVSNGHAVAYRKYSKKYVSYEINAKNEKLGIWQGKFEMPWEYRRKK